GPVCPAIYYLDDSGTESSSRDKTGNSETGTYTLTVSETKESTPLHSGGEEDGGLFDMDKSASSGFNSYESGNDISGIYSRDTGEWHTSTAHETTVNGDLSAEFTEILSDNSSIQRTGNNVTGDYHLTETGTHSSSLVDAG